MKKGSSLLLSPTFSATSDNKDCKKTVNEYPIVPQPNQIIPQEGRFKLSNRVKVIVQSHLPDVHTIAANLIGRLEMTSGITLKEDSQDIQNPSITFIIQKGFPEEGYKLSVTPDAITITASQPNGLFYGVQTLYQLLPPEVYGKSRVENADWSVPAVEIEDAPRFTHRGLMLDVCRHFAPTDYIYKFIDLLAMNKMNIFHWHLTDDQGWRIEIKKYPNLTKIGSRRKETLIDYYYVNYPQQFDNKEHYGYYTQEQIKDIVAYAAGKYITVIPEIEMPGHALAALASYPELSCDPTKRYETGTTWGIFDQVFCPNEDTFRFLEGVMDEVIELFPSRYIHIGGDECPKTAWQNSAFCQQLIKELGLKDDTTPNIADNKKHTKEEKLQSYFITRIEKYLNAKGRNIIGWDEILEGGLAPHATVMSWRGIEGGLNAARSGHNAIMTPNPYLYLDHYQEDPSIAPITIGGYNTLKKTYSYNPVSDDADDLIKEHIIGLQGNIWREYMKDSDRVDYQTYPRAMAIAETGWTLNANKNWKSFCKRMVSDFQRMDIMNIQPCLNFFDVNVHTYSDGNTPLQVVLETYYPDAEIYYTIDESQPGPESIRYQAPFILEGNISLKAAAFKDGKRLGRTTHQLLFGNLISGKSFTVYPHPSNTFSESDELAISEKTFGLTNGKRGNGASYNPWTAFSMEKHSEVEFTVKLERPTQIGKVIFGSLFNPAMGILPAGGISIEVSNDGKQYRKIAEKLLEHFCPPTGRIAFTDSIHFEPTNATFLKVRIKNGGKLRNGIDFEKNQGPETIIADLYIDEIEVY